MSKKPVWIQAYNAYIHQFLLLILVSDINHAFENNFKGHRMAATTLLKLQSHSHFPSLYFTT